VSAFDPLVHVDAVLNLWEAGKTGSEIAKAVGRSLTSDRVNDIVKQARRAGDPRAAPRRQGGHQPLDTVWTPAMCQRVADLVEAGYSTRKIAAEVGLTPQQVAGYINRKGLKLARKAVGGRPKRDKPETAVKPKPVNPYAFSGGFKRRAMVQPKAVIIDGAKPIQSIFSEKKRQGGTLGCASAIEQLGEKSCRFPIGDTRSVDFHFCGADRVAGKPYCLGHCRLAYTVRSSAA